MKLPPITPLFRSATTRLALSYLCIIMVMSIGFSAIFYATSARQLGRQLPPSTLLDNRGGPDDRPRGREIQEFLDARIVEGKRELQGRLIVLNLLTLLIGAGLSYALARRTLRPIEAAMEAQSSFVSDASHELRTPLTVMRTTNEVALRKPKLTLDEAKTIIARNIEETAKLKTLSDGLLKLARSDSGTLLLVPVSLQDVTAEALNHVVAQAQAKDITVEDNAPAVQVMGDKQSLAQAVVVLLDNAIKYSEAGSRVYIEGASQGKHAELSVHDNGPGILATDLPHIFQRFYRADRARSKHDQDGYGIGLAIAQKIVEQHNGHIRVASKPGEGATFTIQLPKAV